MKHTKDLERGSAKRAALADQTGRESASPGLSGELVIGFRAVVRIGPASSPYPGNR